MVPSPQFDEDEDLFNFDEVYQDPSVGIQEEIDIDEFLAAVESDHSGRRQSAMDAALDLPELDPTGNLLEPDAPLPGRGGAGQHGFGDHDFGRTGHGQAPDYGGAYVAPSRMPRWVWFGAAGLALLNVLAVFVVWSSQQRSTEQLDRVRDELTEVARDVRDDVQRQVQNIQRTTSPLVVPAGLPAGSFERIDEALARADFASARRQLYAALAVADHLEPQDRADLEAQAGFLLADTYRLEATFREGGTR